MDASVSNHLQSNALPIYLFIWYWRNDYTLVFTWYYLRNISTINFLGGSTIVTAYVYVLHNDLSKAVPCF